MDDDCQKLKEKLKYKVNENNNKIKIKLFLFFREVKKNERIINLMSVVGAVIAKDFIKFEVFSRKK